MTNNSESAKTIRRKVPFHLRHPWRALNNSTGLDYVGRKRKTNFCFLFSEFFQTKSFVVTQKNFHLVVLAEKIAVPPLNTDRKVENISKTSWTKAGQMMSNHYLEYRTILLFRSRTTYPRGSQERLEINGKNGKVPGIDGVATKLPDWNRER